MLEGNINYAGAVVTWLKDDPELIGSPKDVEPLIERANPEDPTVLVPAFTGIGAPYWQDEARAMFYGTGRTTGKPELVKTAVESMAFQVADVISAMEKDLNGTILCYSRIEKRCDLEIVERNKQLWRNAISVLMDLN